MGPTKTAQCLSSLHNSQGVDKSPFTSCSDTTSKQTTLHSSGDTGSAKAEIIWTLKSVFSGYSVRNKDDFKSTFASMFPDSNIAKMMILNRTKSINAINRGLAPIFKSALRSDLQKSDIRTYSLDESLNEVTQTAKWICICAIGMLTKI